MSTPHVLIDVYPVQKISFDVAEVDYWVAEVSAKGLVLGNNEDPFGYVEHGADEKEAKTKLREHLKECGFSKKQIEYRRV